MMLAAMIVAMMSDMPQRPDAATTRVQVEGSTYRVRVRGSEVEVASKRLLAVKSVANRERMRRAVIEATGCQIIDELVLSPSILQGKLSCVREIQVAR